MFRDRIERRIAKRHEADAVMPDGRDEEWYAFTVEVEALIASGTQKWAEPILRQMQTMVDQTHWVTVGHWQSLRRIRRATRPMHDWARKWPWPVD